MSKKFDEQIKKTDSMSHQDLIRNSHQYKDYLERHPRAKEILGIKANKRDIAKKMNLERGKNYISQIKNSYNHLQKSLGGKLRMK